MSYMVALEDLQKRLRETPSKGSALGGRINVTLSGDLAPLGVEIDEGLMEEGWRVWFVMVRWIWGGLKKLFWCLLLGMSSKVMADAVFLAMREAHNASLELSRTGVSVRALSAFRVAQGSESEVWAPYATCARTELAKFYKEMGVPMPGAGGGCSEWRVWSWFGLLGQCMNFAGLAKCLLLLYPIRLRYLQKVCCCRCSFVVKATIMWLQAREPLGVLTGMLMPVLAELGQPSLSV